jgi:hypothetical protein
MVKLAGAPLPVVEDKTEYIDAGPIVFAIEQREVPADLMVKFYEQVAAAGASVDHNVGDTGGLTVHVFGRRGAGLTEYLRFDCFPENPHYHYIYDDGTGQEILDVDTVANGDPLAWALRSVRTRLRPMLEKVHAADLVDEAGEAAVEDGINRMEAAITRRP